ncbi:DUF4153 domain-containing protein [Bacteroidota bacterium]|nr:DUF4153 domain-containing protein [Bacteroidota bacterium]
MSHDLQNAILKNIHDAHVLETLYRKDKSAFKKEFNAIYPQISSSVAGQCWNERLNHVSTPSIFLSKQELIFIAAAVSVAGCIAKLPHWIGWNPDHFFSRNISFIVFEMLLFFFAWKEKLDFKKIAAPIGIFIISAVFINSLPIDEKSDTLLLSCIHLPIFLWSVVGFVFAGNEFHSPTKRIGFLRLNGDILVMSAVMLLASGLFTIVTMGLFNLIGMNIQEFFANYIVIWGLPAIPIVATVLVKQHPHLVGNVSPIIAKLFTPLVTTTLFIFLIAVISSDKDPYNDREFLFILNAMLIGVMAIIFFSFSEFSIASINRWQLIMLFTLLVLAVVNNSIALSAIIYRLSLFGLSPNRLAVIGSNLLILLHLIFVGNRICRVIQKKEPVEKIGNSIAAFLPVYSCWAAVVAFLFPIIFKMK